jgi:protein tyrosine/serine phosphatase
VATRLVVPLVALASVAGCASTTIVHGVPNLVQIRTDVWRSGQPESVDSWEYLARLGIRHVVKLDFEDEGSDSNALGQGIEVHSVSIEPTTRAGLFDSVEDVFAVPDASRMSEIQSLLRKIRDARGGEGGWLIHCKNGHDRTGLVVGMLRVIVDGWDKHHAWGEMLDRGYHPELIGLDRSFHDFKPEDK